MKYKVGDKVRVRSDLVDGKAYDRVNYFNDMDKWKGKVVTISFVDNDYHYYEIAEEKDSDKWMWSAEMFEDVSDNNVGEREGQ